MKKFFQSKGFIVSSLALLCITILGVCWFVSRDRTGDFRPDESPPSSVTGDWSDGGTQTDGDNGADAYAPGQSTDAEEEYPTPLYFLLWAKEQQASFWEPADKVSALFLSFCCCLWYGE